MSDIVSVLKFALHTVHHLCPLTGENVVQAPGAVFAVAAKDVDFLEGAGATRDPDDRELLAYKHSKGELIDAPAPTDDKVAKVVVATAGDPDDSIG